MHTNARMWHLYDALIDLVPDGLRVEECLVGYNWTLVRSGTTGVALTPPKEGGGRRPCARIQGMPVRTLAQGIKSWDSLDAALGLAAVNSVLNSVEQVECLSGIPVEQHQPLSAFARFKDEVRGRRVAVIGHFPDLDQLQEVCELSILERRPRRGDYPDPACEYILAKQDYVFMTATTIINKTLPRLLKLSRNAVRVLVGPSTPLTPVLFEFGIDVLAGMVAIDEPPFWRTVREAGSLEIFDCGGHVVEISRARPYRGLDASAGT